MTGRDLIIYILENGLEDEPVFFDDGFLNLLTVEEVAEKYSVGVATVRVWYDFEMLKGVRVGDDIYILPNSDPYTNLRKGGKR